MIQQEDIATCVCGSKKQALEESGRFTEKDFWLASKSFLECVREVSKALPRLFSALLGVGNNSLRNSRTVTNNFCGGCKAGSLRGSLAHLSGSSLSTQVIKMLSSDKATGVDEICPNMLWCFPFLNNGTEGYVVIIGVSKGLASLRKGMPTYWKGGSISVKPQIQE